MQLKEKEKRDFLFCFSGRNVRKHENKHRRWGGTKEQTVHYNRKKGDITASREFSSFREKSTKWGQGGTKERKSLKKIKGKVCFSSITGKP